MMERYFEQERIFGKEKQIGLKKKSIAIVGIGAIGSSCAQLLARAGVGNITLIDNDIVELKNIHRQILYDETNINKQKVSCAKEILSKINSEININTHMMHLDETNATVLENNDLVLDCTDNMKTRFAINKFCKKNNIPWIHAAIAGTIGSLFVIDNKSACLECLYNRSADGETCSDAGILNSAVAELAGAQATEALKILTQNKHEADFIRYDFWSHSIKKIAVKKNKNCNICGKSAIDESKDMIPSKELFHIKKCKTKAAYTSKPNKPMDLNLDTLKNKFETVVDTPILIILKIENNEIIVHKHGEIIFKNLTDIEKIKGLSDFIYSIAR